MKRVCGAILALTMMISTASIAFASTGSVEVGGHVGILRYHITYHANGGSGGYDGTYVEAGDAGTVCSLSETGITRSGYRFTGWNTKQDGYGVSYAAGDSITLNSNIILYAQWEERVKRDRQDRQATTGGEGLQATAARRRQITARQSQPATEPRQATARRHRIHSPGIEATYRSVQACYVFRWL